MLVDRIFSIFVRFSEKQRIDEIVSIFMCVSLIGSCLRTNSIRYDSLDGQ